MARRQSAPIPETIANPDWPGLLEAALSNEGSVGDTYARFYRYSMGNIAFLMYQGVTPQPVANYDRWQQLGRHVRRGAKAYYILRPITVKLDELDERGQPKTIRRFKPVKSVFPYEMTLGDPLPDPEPSQEWDKERALKTLDVTEVPFEAFDGNMQGYSEARNIAINPLAKYPRRTLLHELGHVVLGHTEQPDPEYTFDMLHRGLKEFEAEGTAHLALTDIKWMTPDMAAVSRAYLQAWLQGQKPPDKSVRGVFKATDEILRAGRVENCDNNE